MPSADLIALLLGSAQHWTRGLRGLRSAARAAELSTSRNLLISVAVGNFDGPFKLGGVAEKSSKASKATGQQHLPKRAVRLAVLEPPVNSLGFQELRRKDQVPFTQTYSPTFPPSFHYQHLQGLAGFLARHILPANGTSSLRSASVSFLPVGNALARNEKRADCVDLRQRSCTGTVTCGRD